MVKLLFLLLLPLYLSSDSIYQNRCVPCHEILPVDLDKMFYSYLLKYSSEKNVKKSLREYLQNPTKEKSVMSEAFIKRFGVKEPTELNEKELEEAIDTYWNIFKIFGKLE